MRYCVVAEVFLLFYPGIGPVLAYLPHRPTTNAPPSVLGVFGQAFISNEHYWLSHVANLNATRKKVCLAVI